MAKIDMPLSFVDEAKKINELMYTKNLTTTGQATFHSDSSNTDYDTNDESHSGEADVYNGGETGLLKLLIKTFNTEDGGWILTASDLNGKAELNHSHGNISHDGKVGTAADLAIYTNANGLLDAGVLPVKAGGTGASTLTSGSVLKGDGENAIAMISGVGALYASTENDPKFGILPAALGGTGVSSLALLREAIGLGDDEGALSIENGGTGATSVAGARNNLGLGNTDGALPINNGGTGATSVADARNNLGLGNTAGALPVANGGTGASTVAGARNALGLGNTDGALPVANGGTGANTATGARTALGITSGTATPTGGNNGDIYIQYS